MKYPHEFRNVAARHRGTTPDVTDVATRLRKQQQVGPYKQHASLSLTPEEVEDLSFWIDATRSYVEFLEREALATAERASLLERRTGQLMVEVDRAKQTASERAGEVRPA